MTNGINEGDYLGKDRKILMIDDEGHNIDDLEWLIDTSVAYMGMRGIREYAPYAEEAVRFMRESMDSGGRYSVIISDNHLKGGGSDDSLIDGDELLKVITGNAVYAFSGDNNDIGIELGQFADFEDMQRYATGHVDGEDRVLDFLNLNFGYAEEYTDFVDYHFGNGKSPALIMLCGSPSELNLGALEERMDIFQKQPVRVGRGARMLCERSVIDCLIGHGVFTEEAARKAFETHPRFRKGATPADLLYKEVRKK